jgi:hypothetical protein
MLQLPYGGRSEQQRSSFTGTPDWNFFSRTPVLQETQPYVQKPYVQKAICNEFFSAPVNFFEKPIVCGPKYGYNKSQLILSSKCDEEESKCNADPKRAEDGESSV